MLSIACMNLVTARPLCRTPLDFPANYASGVKMTVHRGKRAIQRMTNPLPNMLPSRSSGSDLKIFFIAPFLAALCVTAFLRRG